jgi:hypothetical protein
LRSSVDRGSFSHRSFTTGPTSECTTRGGAMFPA